MDVSSAPATPTQASRGPRQAIWHDLECGFYTIDLPLWRGLVDEAAYGRRFARVLDVGAGTGRVALDLARAGHRVTALDLDPDLLYALGERAIAMGMEVDTACADARTFELPARDFDVCLAPMQTIQLLGGRAGRADFLRRAAAHLRPGGLLACAIVTAVEPFDCSAGDLGPSEQAITVAGTRFISRPTRVLSLKQSILIETERRIVSLRARSEPVSELDGIELDRLSAAELEAEGLAVGLTPEPLRMVASTEDHVGSEVVMLRA